MKIKPKRFRKKKKEKEKVDAVNPTGNNNPFENEQQLFVGEASRKENGVIPEQKVLKGKKKKIKKHKEKKNKERKKAQKLEGKRERAVSKLVLSHIVEDKHQGGNGNHEVDRLLTSKSPNSEVVSSSKELLKVREKKDERSLSQSNYKPKQEAFPMEPDAKILDQKSSTFDETAKTVPESDNTKRSNKRNRPSEGDIRSLRKGRGTQIEDSTNPFVHTELSEIEQLKQKPAATKELHRDMRTRSQSKRHRTSSMVASSRERTKKKRLKLLKKLKRKKKGEKGKVIEEDHEEDQKIREFNPKSAQQPEHRIDQLLQQAEEVKNIVSGKVVENLAKRQSNLSTLMQSTGELEVFAESFATVAFENRIKKQTEAKCCGIFSKHRICWYICSCERGVKKKKKQQLLSHHHGTSDTPCRAFADNSGEDDAYEIQKNSDNSKINAAVRLRNRSNDNANSNNLRKKSYLRNSDATKRSTSSLLTGLRNSRFLETLNRSAVASNEESRSRNHTRLGGRRFSSTGDLSNLLNRRGILRRTIQRSIENVACEYKEANRQTAAAELLLLDHES